MLLGIEVVASTMLQLSLCSVVSPTFPAGSYLQLSSVWPLSPSLNSCYALRVVGIHLDRHILFISSHDTYISYLEFLLIELAVRLTLLARSPANNYVHSLQHQKKRNVHATRSGGCYSVDPRPLYMEGGSTYRYLLMPRKRSAT